MSRCIILGAGETDAPTVARCAPRQEDFVIAADGGYLAAQALGLKADLILGDFDSAPEPQGPQVLRYPVHKDDTDTLLAVREGLARGYRDFVLLGGTGGRLDHTVANLQTLLFLRERGARGVMLAPDHTIWVLWEEELELPRTPGYLSVFAMERQVRVTLRGVEYPLEDALLTPGYPLGVSNRIVEETASVAVRGGALLVIAAQDRPKGIKGGDNR